mgnify:CR=1 FL=1
MIRKLAIVFGMAVLAAMTLAPAAVATGHGDHTYYDELYCDGAYEDIDVEGDVYVGYGDKCEISYSYIEGNVIVDGGKLKLTGSSVYGNIEAEYAKKVIVKDSYIEGNVTAYKTKRNVIVKGNEIYGNIEVAHTKYGKVRIVHNYVDGNITAYENHGDLLIKHNEVCGDVEYYDNYGAVHVGPNYYC